MLWGFPSFHSKKIIVICDLTYCWFDKKLAYFQKINQDKLLIILKLSKYVNNNKFYPKMKFHFQKIPDTFLTYKINFLGHYV